MKYLTIIALLGAVSAVKFLGDSAPEWKDSELEKSSEEMDEDDEKFDRFMAFEKKRKEGKDDYTHNKTLEFYVKPEKKDQ